MLKCTQAMKKLGLVDQAQLSNLEVFGSLALPRLQHPPPYTLPWPTEVP